MAARKRKTEVKRDSLLGSIPELRKGQEELAKQIYDNLLLDTDKGMTGLTNFIGLQAGTGYGKTRTVLEGLRLAVNSFRSNMDGNRLLSELPPKTVNSKAYVFIRTRSQIQAFLREAETLGLSAIVLPSKTFCCYNNVLNDGDDTEALDALNVASTATEKDLSIPDAPSVSYESDNEFDDVFAVAGKECWESDPNLKPVLRFVNGRCSSCPLSASFYYKKSENTLAKTALMEYHKNVPREDSFVILDYFMKVLKSTKDIETAMVEFSKCYPYICPYNLVLSNLKTLDINIVLLTYPYILNPDIRKKMEMIREKGQSMQIVIMDECHNLADLMSSNNDCSLTLEQMTKADNYAFNLIQIGNEVNSLIKNGDKKNSTKYLNEVFYSDMSVINRIYKIVHFWRTRWDDFINVVRDKESHFSREDFKSLFCSSKYEVKTVVETCDSAIIHLEKMLKEKTDVQCTVPKVKKTLTACKKLLNVFQTVNSIICSLDNHNQETGIYYETEDHSIKIKALVYNKIVDEVFNQVDNVIMLSGTMPSLNYWERRMGIHLNLIKTDDTVGNMELISVAGVDSVWGNRNSQTYRTYADIVHAVYEESEKNTLVGFTSNEFMENVADYFPKDMKVLLGRSDANLSDFLNEMNKTNHGVYCIVAGSRFSEGVEYVKDGLSMFDRVVICGIPISPPSMYNNDLQQYYIEVLNLSKNDAYIQVAMEPAFMKLRQLMGRAIRGPNDSCKVYMADNRFVSKPYWKMQFNYSQNVKFES